MVLTGQNGAGKTNILEALSLLTPGRGLRRAKLSEMDNAKAGQPWTISAHVHGMQGEAQIGTGRIFEAETDRRLVKIDGKESRSQAQLANHIAMLWLTPQMEQLFLEGASAGRKFLDRLVYSFDSEHAARVNEYEYAMRERNKLLAVGGDPVWLDSLEQTMAETAVAIAKARLTTAMGVNQTIQGSHLSFPKAILDIEGFAESRLKSGEAEAQTETALKLVFSAGRRQDAAAGRALAGAHKSELRVTHAAKQMPAETCSTGEQKALLLSIVLAQARFSAAKKGVVPVLLLDEVAAHLDAIKRVELFEEICQIGAQTWMTGTDAKLFAELQGIAQFFQVDDGNLHPERA